MLYQIYKFYKVYPIVHALRAQLSWRHYVCLIWLNNDQERLFYQNQIINYSWSYRNLMEQIKSHLYQKINQKDMDEMLKTKLSTVVDLQKIFKPDYNFNFLEIAPRHLEKELEDRILYHRGIPCVVLVDLKDTKFDSRDIGQMNKYISNILSLI